MKRKAKVDSFGISILFPNRKRTRQKRNNRTSKRKVSFDSSVGTAAKATKKSPKRRKNEKKKVVVFSEVLHPAFPATMQQTLKRNQKRSPSLT